MAMYMLQKHIYKLKVNKLLILLQIKAVSAIQKFEEEKKNPKMENYLKKIFYLGENESVNLIQVSLAFSQEAMQNKKKIKDNRKKIPPQNQKGNNTNNSDSNNSNNNNNNNNNSNNKNNKRIRKQIFKGATQMPIK